MPCILLILLLTFASCSKRPAETHSAPVPPKLIAIINTVDDEEPSLPISELNYLTDRLRDIATKTLPQKSYAVMTQLSILSLFSSPEEMLSKCNELGGCLVKLGREIAADYICQARIGRFGKDFTIKVELYETMSGTLIGSFTGISKDIYGLLAILDSEAPGAFRRIMPFTQEVPVDVVQDNVLTDARDGKRYKITKIGTQTWMAENLNYEVGRTRCYDDKQENCAKYGLLYDWDAAMKACPRGWHLPSDDEWMALINFTGTDYNAGTKKLRAKSGWNKGSGYIEGSDNYGFSALPGGTFKYDGKFDLVGDYGFWWSSTEHSEARAWGLSMHFRHVYDMSYIYGNIKSVLYSVRCMKD